MPTQSTHISESERLFQRSRVETVHSNDGTPIAFQRFGAGPPLVLVHGTLDDRQRWMGLVPAFSERFEVIALDRRGRGASGATDPASYGIHCEFEDVAAVVEAIGKPVYLLGHSFGALCSLEVALRTDRVAKLVLYEPPILTPAAAADIQPESLEKLERELRSGDGEAAALTFVREIVGLPEDEISAVRATPDWQIVIDVAHTLAYEIPAVQSYNFDAQRFHGLTTPTLLLRGSESPSFLREATGAVHAALPNSRLVEFEGQAHLALDTAPELFLAEIFEFLADE